MNLVCLYTKKRQGNKHCIECMKRKYNEKINYNTVGLYCHTSKTWVSVISEEALKYV